MRIGIIGSGIVGEATGKAFHSFGNHVVFCDKDLKKLSVLKKEGHYVLPSIEDVTKQSDVIFVCVDTPIDKKNHQDLTSIASVIPQIADGLNACNSKTSVIVRSTLLPNTNRVLNEELRNETDNKDWEYFYNPEFLRTETALEDALTPDRIVVGGVTDNFKTVEELYNDQPATPLITTGLEEAEMIKLVSNNFLATKISFFNEMGMLSRKMKLDVRTIEQAVALDSRIGKYGTRSGFKMKGCLIKDGISFDSKYPTKILRNALKLNEKYLEPKDQDAVYEF